MLAALQYRIWIGEGSLAQKVELQRAVEVRKLQIIQSEQRNDLVDREVKALKKGMDSVEERSRSDLGMIKEGETFYMVIEKSDD